MTAHSGADNAGRTGGAARGSFYQREPWGWILLDPAKERVSGRLIGRLNGYSRRDFGDEFASGGGHVSRASPGDI